MLTDVLVRKILSDNPTPVYLYDCQRMFENISNLVHALPEESCLYFSMKANPLLGICQCVKRYISNIEVSSEGELRGAIKAGYKNENILFSGPGKRYEELLEAVRKEVKINVESIQEINVIKKICTSLSMKAKVMIRINPESTDDSAHIKMSGLPSQFGIDYSEIDEALRIIVNSQWIILVGFATYMGSQILNADAIVLNTDRIFRLCIELKKRFSLCIQEIDVGGGFGVSYYDEKQLNLSELKSGLNTLFERFRKELVNVKTSFESGRYLLANCGYYITKVLYVKKARDRTYVICDGGFNNVLLASFFTREIRGNFNIKLIKNSFHSISDNAFEYYISGPLCSPTDLVGIKVSLPFVEKDDYILISNVGAYGLTYSPINFISHPIPAEILINKGEIHIARKRSSVNDLFNSQFEIPAGFV